MVFSWYFQLFSGAFCAAKKLPFTKFGFRAVRAEAANGIANEFIETVPERC